MSYESDPGWQYLRQSADAILAVSILPEIFFENCELTFQAQTKKFDSKKNVWIPDAEEQFVEAEIKATKGDDVIVVTDKGVEV
jgi:hypothetical protein